MQLDRVMRSVFDVVPNNLANSNDIHSIRPGEIPTKSPALHSISCGTNEPCIKQTIPWKEGKVRMYFLVFVIFFVLIFFVLYRVVFTKQNTVLLYIYFRWNIPLTFSFCDLGHTHRQPFISITSSKTNHNAKHDCFGAVYNTSSLDVMLLHHPQMFVWRRCTWIVAQLDLFYRNKSKKEV